MASAFILFKITTSFSTLLTSCYSPYNEQDPDKAFYYEMISEEFKEDVFKQSALVRLISPFFKIKMIIFSMTVATLQFIQFFNIFILVTVQGSYLIFVIVMTVRYRPFSSKLGLIHTIVLEITMTIFLALVMLKNLGDRVSPSVFDYLQYPIIFAALLSVLVEFIAMVVGITMMICEKLKKKEKTEKDS